MEPKSGQNRMRVGAALLTALVVIQGRASAGDASPLPAVPKLGADGTLRPNVGPPPPPSGMDPKGNPIPLAPEPPDRPGGASNSYYSTCGGTHPPVKYSFPSYNDYQNKDGSYGLTDEAKKYFESPEYKKYAEELNKYKQDYAASPGTYGKVDPKTGERISSGFVEDEDGPAFSATVKTVRLDRDPNKDLASWLRGVQYHEPVRAVTFEGGAEGATSLEVPQAGPAATASYYGKLVGMLDPSVQANAPAPLKLLETLEVLWEAQWRRNLGFETDPGAKQLSLDLERARRSSQAAVRNLEGLLKRSLGDEVAKLQLHEQVAFASREVEASAAKEATLRVLLDRRMLFIRALVDLVRLAPDGGFGPTFAEANPNSVQAAAGKILAQIGPMCARTLWQGLARDLQWLVAQEGAAAEVKTGSEYLRRKQAVDAAQALLLDPRLDGLGAICDFIREYPVAPAEVLRKAFELLDKLGTLTLRPETLTTLPQLLAHLKNQDAGVAERARWMLLRIMGLRSGKVSLEETIRHLGPLVGSGDRQVAEAALAFLNYHTGQQLGAEPQAWAALHEKMKAERERIKAEKEKAAAHK